MRIGELLSSAAVPGAVVATGDERAHVRSVHLAESAADIEVAEPGSAVLLTHAAAAVVRGYRFDVLMSRARSAQVPLVVLPCLPSHLPAPASDLAAAVCVVAVPPDAPVGALVTDIARELGGQDSRLVRMMHAAYDAMAALSGEPFAESQLSSLFNPETMELRLESRDSDVPPGWITEAADAERHWVIRPGEAPPFACRLVVQAANSVLLNAQDPAGSPDRTVATLIGELLSSDATMERELGHRARTLGFDLDGFHLVLALEIQPPDDGAADLDRLQLEQTAKSLALRALNPEATSWSWSQRGNSLLFVRTWIRPPVASQLEQTSVACQDAVTAVATALGHGVRVTAGRSGPHAHAQGLRRAAAEARSAARSFRTDGVTPSVAAFDEFGLDRALIDWYLSEAGASAASKLAPLIALPATKGDTLLRTLGSYLDHQGSVTDTAHALFLHRNAVRYRLDQIKELLDSDLSDPDERLSLHLACRGWALATSRPR